MKVHGRCHCGLITYEAEIDPARVPVIAPEVERLIARDCIPGGTRDNLEASAETVAWGETSRNRRILLCDAQTSGGLLIAVAPKKLKAVLALLRKERIAVSPAIGRIRTKRKTLICMTG